MRRSGALATTGTDLAAALAAIAGSVDAAVRARAERIAAAIRVSAGPGVTVDVADAPGGGVAVTARGPGLSGREFGTAAGQGDRPVAAALAREGWQ